MTDSAQSVKPILKLLSKLKQLDNVPLSVYLEEKKTLKNKGITDQMLLPFSRVSLQNWKESIQAIDLSHQKLMSLEGMQQLT